MNSVCDTIASCCVTGEVHSLTREPGGAFRCRESETSTLQVSAGHELGFLHLCMKLKPVPPARHTPAGFQEHSLRITHILTQLLYTCTLDNHFIIHSNSKHLALLDKFYCKKYKFYIFYDEILSIHGHQKICSYLILCFQTGEHH